MAVSVLIMQAVYAWDGCDTAHLIGHTVQQEVQWGAWHLTSLHQTHPRLPQEKTNHTPSVHPKPPKLRYFSKNFLFFYTPPSYRTSEIENPLWPQEMQCQTPLACELLKPENDFVGSVIFLTQPLILFFSSVTYYEHKGEGEKWEESILFADHFNLFILENSIQTHFPRKQHDTNYHEQQAHGEIFAQELAMADRKTSF